MRHLSPHRGFSPEDETEVGRDGKDTGPLLHYARKLLAGRTLIGALLAGALLTGTTIIGARASVAQSPQSKRMMRVQVQPSTSLEVSGSPTITLSSFGEEVETSSDAATYGLVTNTGAPKEIRASLDQLPPGLSLQASVSAPESKGRGAESSGWTPLSTGETVVVQDIQKADDSGVPIAYKATATAGAAPKTYSLTVTYTITRSQ
ncbi:hypothetical protein [Salinibacter ruber]|uniref:hypothetical protein n=1 Tax=Salinibacter ruber TaxID=146919 RepID=UPI00161E4B52|nr:hypothetical protein [Salinibacter ruber]MBB4090888.1 hypothetical protein [Salinibacter ruber]MCS3675168.1 hypothetical protein [Salinibacter ruber]MCS3785086.1 hypothetical protein [Salinibacter ruber]